MKGKLLFCAKKSRFFVVVYVGQTAASEPRDEHLSTAKNDRFSADSRRSVSFLLTQPVYIWYTMLNYGLFSGIVYFLLGAGCADTVFRVDKFPFRKVCLWTRDSLL